jgi:cyclophilin family peptidyl-prolyl cis-trans isomerase
VAALPPQKQEKGTVPNLKAAYFRALPDKEEEARLSALAGLALAKGDDARDAILPALGDPAYLVRRKAAEILRDNFSEDHFSEVGKAETPFTAKDYLEAVDREGRKVTASFDTEAGAFRIELYAADAPLTVHNFIRLARAGELDNRVFHRVVPGFVIQDGDPRGDGNGGPPWRIRCEINIRRYVTGSVGMALSGKDTGGSQYFVTQTPQPHLDGGYTLFGQILEGQEIVDRMVQGTMIRKVTITQE